MLKLAPGKVDGFANKAEKLGKPIGDVFKGLLEEWPLFLTLHLLILCLMDDLKNLGHSLLTPIKTDTVLGGGVTSLFDKEQYLKAFYTLMP
jgi:hypothetical protein